MPKRIRRSLDEADNLGETSDRDDLGRFRPGNRASVGNASNSANRGVRRMIRGATSDEDLAAIIATAIRAARRGDRFARAWIFDRLGGTTRQEADDERAPIELPDLADLESCAEAQRAITSALSSGEITLSAAERLAQLVTATADRLRDVDLEARIAELEHLRPTTETDDWIQ